MKNFADFRKGCSTLMNNNFGLSERTIEELLKYFSSKPEIEKVLIYGSRAKGSFHIGSDIDFAIWTEDSDKISTYLWELDELSTPYKFDVTDYKNLNYCEIKNSIDRDGILFYERK